MPRTLRIVDSNGQKPRGRGRNFSPEGIRSDSMLIALGEIRRHAGGLHVARARIPAGVVMTGHRHDEPTILAVTRGAMRARDNGIWHDESEGSMHFLPPGSPRSVMTGEFAVDCLVISADANQPVGRHRFWQRPEPLHLAKKAAGHHYAALRTAVDDSENINALEDAMLSALSSLSRSDQPHSHPPWLAAAVNILQQSQANAAETAHEVGVHRVHLARVIHETYGMTLREYMRRVRVERATRLLRDPAYTVTRVAHQSAFADHSHLCREFGRRVGVTPTAYREELRHGHVASVQASDVPEVEIGVLTRVDQLGDTEIECDDCDTMDGLLGAALPLHSRHSS